MTSSGRIQGGCLAARSPCKQFVARLSLAALLSTAVVCAQADIEGAVEGVSDGDTLTVLDERRTLHKVRLAGIDAPEKGQAFAANSKRSLSDCAFGRRARVEGEKVDRYGRVVGKVFVQGVDCNLRQVQLGLAWHYKLYQREQTREDRASYADAEEKARGDLTGLWREPTPQAPWIHRRDRR